MADFFQIWYTGVQSINLLFVLSYLIEYAPFYYTQQEMWAPDIEPDSSAILNQGPIWGTLHVIW